MNIRLRNYVKTHLNKELQQVKNSNRIHYLKQLDEFEKTIIFKYTENGYEPLNQTLRNDEAMPEYGEFLVHSLKKLEDYRLLCYRTIKCNLRNLKKYYDAYDTDSVITEKSFLSCSRSKAISLYFSKSPLFIIKSKKGKNIESIAKYGIDSGQNEKEILFMPGSKFKVLEINDSNENIVIKLEEV